MLLMTATYSDCVALLYGWHDNTYSIYVCADLNDDGYASTELITNHYDTLNAAAWAMPVGQEEKP